MSPPSLRPVLSYSSAAILVVLAALLRVILAPMIGPQLPYMPFFFALIIAAWLGGMGASLAALFLSLAAVPLVVAPIEQKSPALTRQAAAVDGASVAMGLVATLLGTSLRTSQSRAAESLRLVAGERRRSSEECARRRAAEEEKDLLRSLSDAIPQIVWISRPGGQQLEFINRRWSEYTGLDPGEAMSAEAWRKVVHPDDLPRVVEALAHSDATGAIFEAEYRLRHASGAYRWFLGRAAVIAQSPGSNPLRFGSATDIDDRKRAELGTRLLAAVGAAVANVEDDSTAFGQLARLAVSDFADWCIVHMRGEGGSPVRLAVAHADPRRATLADNLFRRHGIGPEPCAGSLRVLRTGQPELVPEIDERRLFLALDDLADHPEGQEAAREALRGLGIRSAIAVPLRGREGTLGAFTFLAADSRHPYDEADLRLALEVADRAAAAVENARLFARVERADRRKDEFLAILAHELRNPLAPIHNALVLMGNPGVDLQAERSLAMRMVSHLARLVEDLVDVSRLTRGRIELRRQIVELGPIVERAVESATSSDREWQAGVSVSLPRTPVLVNADSARLEQVLWNLLDNALKYTGPGGRVHLTVEARGGEVIIRVADTGVGIPAEILPNIFDMFYRAEAPRGVARGGLGIGLCLVKSLVEMHGGTIEARSEGAGEGSEFVVTLPLPPFLPHPLVAESRSEPARSRPTGPAKGQTESPRRILIVDDNRDAATSLARLLEAMEGDVVRVAHDGHTALDIARDFRPEIAILDIGMPDMDGLELARHFRADALLAKTRLLALSGWGHEEDRERSREAGFDQHLVKPVDLDELRKALLPAQT
ncbi:ATP-binding protein [Aquisphaera giovannonii]|uniref:ATP-binding protein n=1 Tax=Aquisphaera giovannonii TaxID=406548 RepID=UPI00143CD6F4|nr:ATP-binding protein [Aquisphaera giovannonii]